MHVHLASRYTFLDKKDVNVRILFVDYIYSF